MVSCTVEPTKPHARHADPNRQIATPPQAFVVLCIVRHTVLLLRNLVATNSVEFVRHL